MFQRKKKERQAMRYLLGRLIDTAIVRIFRHVTRFEIRWAHFTWKPRIIKHISRDGAYEGFQADWLAYSLLASKVEDWREFVVI